MAGRRARGGAQGEGWHFSEGAGWAWGWKMREESGRAGSEAGCEVGAKTKTTY